MPLTRDLDNIDRRVAADLQEAYDTPEGPRPGDWCKVFDGSLRRFSSGVGALDFIFEDGSGGSYQLREDGSVSFSGGLDHFFHWPEFSYLLQGVQIIGHPDFELLPETKLGAFWFFRDKYRGIGCEFEIPCRVYKLLPPPDDIDAWVKRTVEANKAASEARRKKRRSDSAKEAAKTRKLRRDHKVLLVAEKGRRKQGIANRTHCYVCGKRLSDPMSAARGIGPECWQDVLTRIDALNEVEAAR